MPPPGSHRRCGGGTDCAQGQPLPHTRGLLLSSPSGHMLGGMSPHQPVCGAAAPMGYTCLAPVLASILWVTPRWLWAPAAHTQTLVQGTRSTPGHPLPPASAVFQRLNWRGDEAELLTLALFPGLGFADGESPGLEGGRCLRRGHTNSAARRPSLPNPRPCPLGCSHRVSSHTWKACSPHFPTGGSLRAMTCPQVSYQVGRVTPGAVSLPNFLTVSPQPTRTF